MGGMDGGEIRTKRWSRLEAERLIDGLLVVREPQGSPHTTVIEVVTPERLFRLWYRQREHGENRG